MSYPSTEVNLAYSTSPADEAEDLSSFNALEKKKKKKEQRSMNLHWASDVQGSLNKFPDFFRMGTFIDSTHMKF